MCDKETDKGMVCHNCLNYLPLVKPPLCRHCGRPVKKGASCPFCSNESKLDHGRAWLVFMPPSDRLIHHYKYRKKTKLVHLFGRAMALLIRTDPTLKHADIMTPVPLFWWKRLRRGYNQAALLSKIIGQETGIPVKDLLKRVKNTKTQTRLSESEREKNVLNAFTVQMNNIKDQSVLLIDDVLTTGATLNECARVLKQAGAAEVYSCVAAITPDAKSSSE